MNTFRKSNIVRCISDDSKLLTKGRLYKVMHASSSRGVSYIYILLDTGDTGGMLSRRFILEGRAPRYIEKYV